MCVYWHYELLAQCHVYLHAARLITVLHTLRISKTGVLFLYMVEYIIHSTWWIISIYLQKPLPIQTDLFPNFAISPFRGFRVAVQ